MLKRTQREVPRKEKKKKKSKACFSRLANHNHAFLRKKFSALFFLLLLKITQPTWSASTLPVCPSRCPLHPLFHPSCLVHFILTRLFPLFHFFFFVFCFKFSRLTNSQPHSVISTMKRCCLKHPRPPSSPCLVSPPTRGCSRYPFSLQIRSSFAPALFNFSIKFIADLFPGWCTRIPFPSQPMFPRTTRCVPANKKDLLELQTSQVFFTQLISS